MLKLLDQIVVILVITKKLGRMDVLSSKLQGLHFGLTYCVKMNLRKLGINIGTCCSFHF